MADFRIWGRVEHIGPSDFFVIAPGVSEARERLQSLAEAEEVSLPAWR
jgi:hypothetical protein